MLPSSPYLLTRARLSVDASTTAWINAVVAAGGSVSAAQSTKVDALIKGIKADSNWNVLDRLWLWGGESNSSQARIDVKALVTGTAFPTLTLGASGYTGDAVAGYFDTNTNLATFGGNYSQNSGAVGLYIFNSRTATQAWRACGVSSTGGTTNFTSITPMWSDGNVYSDVNDAGPAVAVAGNAQGQWIASRTAASGAGALELRKNQASFATATSASTGVASTNFVFAALNDSVSGRSGFSGDTFAAGFISGGLTSAQSDQIASRINAYMQAWGINVY